MKKKENKQMQEGKIVETQMPQKPKKKRKKSHIIIAIIVILFVVIRLVSCAFMPDTAAIVNTTTATRGDLQESISTSGMVESEEKKVIFAPVTGTLTEVNVEAGDSVKAGEVLAGYNMEDMDNRLQQATLQQEKSDAVYKSIMSDNSKSQAKLNEANTNLGVLEQQLKDYNARLEDLQEELSKSQRETNNALAQESLNLQNRSAELQLALQSLDTNAADYAERLKEIKEEQQSVSADLSYNQYMQQTASSSDYVTEMQKEIAEVQKHIAECEAYKAEMKSQKMSNENTVMNSNEKKQYSTDNELANLTYEQAQKEYDIAKNGICAEFDGIVTECSIVSGATVSEGMQLLTLENSKAVKISFSASKNDVEKLELGQKAEIIISGNVYDGEVSKIDRMASVNASNTPMVGVEIHITNPDDKIILGLDAKLTIYTDKAENAFLIPVEAINADKDGDFLYVVENGVVVKKMITCGISSDLYTEVIEGITEEDQIILSLVMGGTIEEGMAVTAMPEQ